MVNGGSTQTWTANIDRTPPAAPQITGLNNGDAYYDSDAPVVTAQQSDAPAAGAGVSSGPVTLSIAVDGGPATTQPCGATCTWSPPANLAEGQHTLAFSTIDGAGNQGAATTVAYTVDQTPPSVAVSGPAFDAQSSAPTTGNLALHVDASDPSTNGPTSGVVQISTYVDENQSTTGPSAAQTCQGGGCSLSADGTIDFSQLAPGEHTIEVTATDAADNLGSQTWTVEVGASPQYTTPACTPGTPVSILPSPSPQTLSQVIASLQQTVAGLLGNPTGVTIGDQSVAPSLASVAGGLNETGTSTGGFIGSNGQGSFGVGDATNSVCVNPVATTNSVSAGQLYGTAAAIFANTGLATNSALRPTAFGIEDFQQMIDPTAPAQSTWQVTLTSGEQLEQLDPQTVAVVDNTGVSGITVPVPNVSPGSGTVAANTALDSQLANASDQVAAESATLADAEAQVTSGNVVAVLTAPQAVDSGGHPLSTSLTAVPLTNTVALNVQGAQNFPAVAGLMLVDGSEESTANSTASSDVGPPDNSTVTTDSTGDTVTTTPVQFAASAGASGGSQRGAAPLPFTCTVSTSYGAARDAYPFASSAKYSTSVTCPGLPVTVTARTSVENLHHKTIDGPHKCKVTPQSENCSQSKKVNLTQANFTYKLTVKVRLTGRTQGRTPWAPLNGKALKGCVGYGSPAIYCSFSYTFQVFDHRCDLTTSGYDPTNPLIPFQGDKSKRYTPVSGVAPFVATGGRSAILNVGFWTLTPKTLVGGFGLAHIQIKHGWDTGLPNRPIYTGSSSTPNEDDTRQALQSVGRRDPNDPHSFVYDSSQTYPGVAGVSCRRRVVIQPTAPKQKHPGGIITSFGRTAVEGDDAG